MNTESSLQGLENFQMEWVWGGRGSFQEIFAAPGAEEEDSSVSTKESK